MTIATIAREWLWFIRSPLVTITRYALNTAFDTSEYRGNYVEATIVGYWPPLEPQRVDTKLIIDDGLKLCPR